MPLAEEMQPGGSSEFRRLLPRRGREERGSRNTPPAPGRHPGEAGACRAPGGRRAAAGPPSKDRPAPIRGDRDGELTKERPGGANSPGQLKRGIGERS